jgi:hypothetical protein
MSFELLQTRRQFQRLYNARCRLCNRHHSPHAVGAMIEPLYVRGGAF